MKPAIIDGKCRLVGHCHTCRSDAEWRKLVGTPEICPHGVDYQNVDSGIGSLIEKMVKPIAKAFGMNCLDEKNKLKEGSRCAKRRDNLNLKK